MSRRKVYGVPAVRFTRHQSWSPAVSIVLDPAAPLTVRTEVVAIDPGILSTTPDGSSLRTVPLAVVVPSVAPEALDRTTLNVSSGSTVVSPATLTVIVLLVSPAAKLTIPVGKVPPVKSLALAAVPTPDTA